MKIRKMLLTGAAGFLGGHVASTYSSNGWEVHGIGRGPVSPWVRAHLTNYTQLSLPHPDLAGIVERIRPDVCIHSAGSANPGRSVTDPASDYRHGPAVLFELLDTLRRAVPECKVVFFSSAAIYGDPVRLPISESDSPAPISPYGFHKLQAELIMQEFHRIYGMATCSLRIFSAYGPGLRRQVVWDLINKLSVASDVSLRGVGTESRDFIHGRDVAAATECVVHRAPFRADVYNLASGQETTIRGLAETIRSCLNRASAICFDGIQPVGIPLRWSADISRIRALGFSPSIDLVEGVSEVVRWASAEAAA